MLEALCYLHSCGIMHRDIKPENVLLQLNQDNQRIVTLKLIDFGLACILRPNEYVTDPCGTPTYVAPEVIRKEPYNSQIDMWSLGVVTFFMYLLPHPSGSEESSPSTTRT
jgi:doublecortin-like kinase 1/2